MDRRTVALFLMATMAMLLPAAHAQEAEDVMIDGVLAKLKSCGIRAEGSFLTMREAARLQDFRSLVRTETWTEQWPGEAGTVRAIEVTGEIWTDAIQAAIDRHKAVLVPAREHPYYLDRPIVLRSGCRFVAAPTAEFRLKPGTNTCMVRNASPVSGQTGPLPPDTKPDREIRVEGGVWTTLRTRMEPALDNGNTKGRLDAQDSVPGGNGVFCFCNVRGLHLRDVVIRQSTAFGVHLAGVDGFLIEGVTLEDHGRDGVHLNGPCRDGVVRRIRGLTYDDFVALNAWDWKNCTPTFGPIERIIVEDLAGSDRGGATLRLLPGNKTFSGGRTLACDVRDCVFRNISGLFAVKMYDQPNLELGAANDFSDPIGRISRVRFRGVTVPRAESPAMFQIHADVDGMRVENVHLAFHRPADYRLVSIGPQSLTIRPDPNNPSTWVEVFSPDKDCTVRHLSLAKVTQTPTTGGSRRVPISDPESLVGVIQLKLNPKYPATTPRGGTGKGVWIRP